MVIRFQKIRAVDHPIISAIGDLFQNMPDVERKYHTLDIGNHGFVHLDLKKERSKYPYHFDYNSISFQDIKEQRALRVKNGRLSKWFIYSYFVVLLKQITK